MKKHLGNMFPLLILFFLSVCSLHAEDFRFTARVDTPAPYLKAPVLLSVDINQTNPDVVLLFQFDVAKSGDFLIKQIDALHDDTMYHTHHHYLYRIYPLKTGPVKIGFELVKRVTDEHKMAYSASGDRDDFKKLETRDIRVTVPPVTLKVRPLPKGTVLVGDFTIERDIPRTKGQSHEPLPLKVSIRGRGYPPVIAPLYPPVKGVKFFSQKPEVKQKVSREGIVYTVVYTFSLSSQKSFTLPELLLKAFDPEKGEEYTLSLPSQRFEITPPDTDSLLDRTDEPRPMGTDLSWLGTFLGYLAVFFAGYMTALSLKWKRKVTAGEKEPLAEKIEACRNEKALLQLLMAADSSRFEKAIGELEKSLYKKGGKRFKKIKEEILESMK